MWRAGCVRRAGETGDATSVVIASNTTGNGNASGLVTIRKV